MAERKTRERTAHGPRVVLALSSAEQIDVLVDTTTVIAKAVKGEISGLFVNTTAMFEAASLSFTRATTVSETLAPFSHAALRKCLSRDLDLVRRRLALRAVAADVRYSIKSRKGDPVHIARQASGKSDFVVLQSPPTAIGVRDVLRSALRVAEVARGVVILPPGTGRWTGPVAVLDDGSEESDRVLDLAAVIGKAMQRDVVSILAVEDPSRARAVTARRQNDAAGPPAYSSIHLPASDGPNLAAAIRHMEPALVLADTERFARRNPDGIVCLLRATHAPVLLLNQA